MNVAPLQKTVTPGAWTYLAIAIAFLFAFSGQYDPDFEAYKIIYEFGGAWLQTGERDPGFVYLVNMLESHLTYQQFRYTLCAVFGLVLWRLAPRLGAIDHKTFAFAQALAVTPFILLKFHVQVREGMALALWLLAVTRNGGMINLRSPLFWILAAMSSAIHIGALVMWAATIAKRRWLILLIFAAYGFLSISEWREPVVLLFVDESSALIRDTGRQLEVTEWKLLYWSMFIILPFLVIGSHSMTTLLGLIGAYGLLAYFPIAVGGALLLGAGEGEFSNVLRVAHTLTSLLAIQLSISRPKWLLTWAVWLFALSDVIRLLVIG